MPNPFSLHGFFEDLSRARTRLEAFAALARRAEEALVVSRVLIAIFDEDKGVWLGYGSDGAHEWVALEIGLLASLSVLDEVRQRQTGVRAPFQYREMGSQSWKRQAIRHALGVPMFHLGSNGERSEFAGCLYLDRRDEAGDFSETDLHTAQEVACAAEAGLLTLRQAGMRLGEPEKQRDLRARKTLMRALIAQYHGNIHKMSEDERALAVYGSNSPRSLIRHDLMRLGLEAEARDARNSIHAHALLDHLRHSGDLIATARAFRLSWRGMDYRIRKSTQGTHTLRTWLEAHGLDWEALHGPAFKQSRLNQRKR